MWVSIASDAACAAALQQAVVGFGVYDTDTLQAVLQFPESAAGFARALCTVVSSGFAFSQNVLGHGTKGGRRGQGA